MKLIDKLTDRKNEPVERKSLLPNNATPLERAVEGTHARLDQVPVPINDLYSPQRMPGELIPFMAWQVAINDFNDDWPEEIKRRLIANSYVLHAQKGTKWAIDYGLSLLNITADVEEWYQYSGRPYHFRVTVNLDSQSVIIGEQLYYDTLRTIYDKKNARSWLDGLRVTRTREAEFIAGVGSKVTIRVDVPLVFEGAYSNEKSFVNFYSAAEHSRIVIHADVPLVFENMYTNGVTQTNLHQLAATTRVVLTAGVPIPNNSV